jgi:hypothetical protein
MRTCSLLALSAFGLILLPSCRDPKIREYRVAKESSPPSSGMAGMQGMAVPNAATGPAPGIHWQKPDNWQEQPGTQMRIGSFLIPGTEGRKAEVAVTTFPGDVGGDFANVNRWRGPIQLPPIAETELPTAITTIDLPTGKFQLIDITSTDPLIADKYKARILGAWLKQPERIWFFKLMGDAETVGAQREALLGFLRSIEFTAPSPANEASNTNNLPVAPLASSPVAPPPAPDSGLTWTAPSTWVPKPLGQMRKGSYTVPGENGQDADLSITMFAAASNPLLENINRWRRQVSLGPITADQIATETTNIANGNLKFTLVDLPGTAAGAANRTLGAILYFGDEAWFFKLSGPDVSVAKQKAAFVDFLKTVNPR